MTITLYHLSLHDLDTFTCLIASSLKEGACVHLEGDLGSGKTAFCQALLVHLGVRERVKSPTYTLIETYCVDGLCIRHCDLYRLDKPEQTRELDLDEAPSDPDLLLIEWPERLGPLIPTRAIHIHLKDQGEGRCLAMRDQRG